MKDKPFSTMLAPNQLASFEPTDDNKKFYVGDLVFPLYASFKIDGVRCMNKHGEILSRSLKQIQNIQIREKIEPIRLYSEQNNCLFDGELYAHGIPFGLISSCVMTKDHNTKLSVKRWKELCEEHDINVTRKEVFNRLKFNCFDYIDNENYNQPYIERVENYSKLSSIFDETFFEAVKVFTINSMQELKEVFEKVLAEGYEGLILRDKNGRYRFGRATIKDALIFKIKPFADFDAQIVGVEQATVVNPNAEKKTNELGRSVTSKKKEDRILIERASGFIVEYEGNELVIPLGKHTNEKKDEVWKNRDSYIGRWIEYHGMTIGMKDVPRIPKFGRYREDKDE